AILGRHGGIGLGSHPPYDVFVNVVGGVRVDEPGVDLAIALAIASAARGVALKGQLVQTDHGSDAGGAPCACFGELGLTGELRWVGHPERRLAEASRHGLSDVLAPTGSGSGAREASTLRDALHAALPAAARRPARAAA